MGCGIEASLACRSDRIHVQISTIISVLRSDRRLLDFRLPIKDLLV